VYSRVAATLLLDAFALHIKIEDGMIVIEDAQEAFHALVPHVAVAQPAEGERGVVLIASDRGGLLRLGCPRCPGGSA
jgi:hypothetical protein